MSHEDVFRQMVQAGEADPIKPEDLDYPIPDPAWDYAQLWKLLHESLEPELENLFIEIQKHENATPESDKVILIRLQWLETYIQRCKSYLSLENN